MPLYFACRVPKESTLVGFAGLHYPRLLNERIRLRDALNVNIGPCKPIEKMKSEADMTAVGAIIAVI